MSNDTLIGPNFDASTSPEFKAKLREALRGDQRTATVINDLISERHQDKGRIAALEARDREAVRLITSLCEPMELKSPGWSAQVWEDCQRFLASSQSQTEVAP